MLNKHRESFVGWFSTLLLLFFLLLWVSINLINKIFSLWIKIMFESHLYSINDNYNCANVIKKKSNCIYLLFKKKNCSQVCIFLKKIVDLRTIYHGSFMSYG